MNNLGLTDNDLEIIVSVLVQFPEINRARVFGSRAKGNYRLGSDVDIALDGEGLTLAVVSQIGFVLNEETSLPYHFDVLNYHSLTNKELVAHIDRVGVAIYLR
jgi:Predicted nucleotidyltransferases